MSFKMPLTDVEAKLRQNSIQVGESWPLKNKTGTQLKLTGGEFSGVTIACYDTTTVVVQGCNPAGIEKVQRVLGITG